MNALMHEKMLKDVWLEVQVDDEMGLDGSLILKRRGAVCRSSEFQWVAWAQWGVGLMPFQTQCVAQSSKSKVREGEHFGFA